MRLRNKMAIKTSYQGSLDKTARAAASNLPISRKAGYEIANAIRGKKTSAVIAYLEKVVGGSQPVPYKRFNDNVGHKPGMAAGRYPIKAAKHILYVVNGAVKNAQDKGLNADQLVLIHISVQQGEGQWRYGRQRRRQMKAAHVEVMVQEVSE